MGMKRIVLIFVFLLSCTALGAKEGRTECTEPIMADYEVYPLFQSVAALPNIVILLDNGAEMQHAVTHQDYDPTIIYEPVRPVNGSSGTTVEATNPGDKTYVTGFYDENGYAMIVNGSTYMVVPIKDDLLPATKLEGGLIADLGTTNTFTLRVPIDDTTYKYKTVTLPALSSAAVDSEGIKDNAGLFRYSKNYLNWLFFHQVTSSQSGVTPYDLSALPEKSRFYYAKKAIFTVAKETLRQSKFAVYNFANVEGASQVQPIGYVALSGIKPDGLDNDSDGMIDEFDEILESNFINNINNMGTVTYSPLAEGMTSIGTYFASPSSHIVGSICEKGFIILVSPGESSADVTDQSKGVPASLSGIMTGSDVTWDADDAPGGIGEGNIKVDEAIKQIPVFQHPTDPSLNGSTWLDDVAAYMATHDMVPYQDGTQYLMTYTIGFMGSALSNLYLTNTSNNGNGNINLYDTTDPEYGRYHFEAGNPDQLASELLAAVNDILQRAASGTAVSVLATSGEGEGNLVQAYFKPSVIISGATEVKWVGFLQSAWVDGYGNLREDTDGDLALDETKDKVIVYFMDTDTNEAKVKRFQVSGTTPYPDVDSDVYEETTLEGIKPLWEAGSVLAERSADDRKIFTYLDKDQDGVLDEPSGDFDLFDDSGEAIRFHISGVSEIIPYLGVRDDLNWSYLGASHQDRGLNLIEFIRGKETGFSGAETVHIRTRLINGNVWKLGDIVHSTPVTVAKPPENFHVIYGDKSYQEYYNAFKDREMMVYVGANDGMLHAFTSWKYDGSTSQYTRPSGAPLDESIGEEIWAYVPQALLPHLKWLPASNYGHSYYVDLKPKVFDAKILPDDTHYTDADNEDNWGTILLVGLNMGGKNICVADSFNDGSGAFVEQTRQFSPSYICMDVTEPRNPRLLWERTYQGLGMSMSIPAVVKVKNKWLAVFGSGVVDYQGNSNQNGHVFVVDLKTGNAYSNDIAFTSGVTNGWLFQTPEANAFLNSPSSIDKNLNYNVDAVYFGGAYDDSGVWKGKAYRIGIPWDWTDTATYVDNPKDAINPWTFSVFLDATRPVTAPISLSQDNFENVWVYFGTGRYLGLLDKISTDTQYMFGVVDPFFNSYYSTYPEDYYHNYSNSLTLDMTRLFNADPYAVTTTGSVYSGGVLYGSWNDLVETARTKDGWYRTLTSPRERIVNKATLLGGIVFVPSFIPTDDICGFGGDSYLYGLYFETGTAYYESSFNEEDIQTSVIGDQEVNIVQGAISLGRGKASALGIHVGQEEGGKAFIQQSTGTVLGTHITPAFNVKSGLMSWKQK